MQTFRQLDKHLGFVPGRVARTLGAVENAAGQEMARRSQYRDTLGRLVEIARIQSTEASNAIESIRAPRRRIEALLKEQTAPANRSEEEIAGYRDVLDTIHASTTAIPFSINVLLQFHRDLYRYTPVRHAGAFKVGSNEVTETHPDGTVAVRFKPVDTRFAIEELHQSYDQVARLDQHHPLLLIAVYLFDFLMIHPFQDGNGRMSRLITLLLLYHEGYGVGRYISLEKLIDDTRGTYCESLRASTPGWHESNHDIWPWIRYLLGVLTGAYKELEERVGLVGGRGSKTEAIKQFIRGARSETFAIEDVRQASPAVSDALIRRVLNELRALDPPAVERVTLGRSAHWRRLRDDF